MKRMGIISCLLALLTALLLTGCGMPNVTQTEGEQFTVELKDPYYADGFLTWDLVFVPTGALQQELSSDAEQDPLEQIWAALNPQATYAGEEVPISGSSGAVSREGDVLQSVTIHVELIIPAEDAKQGQPVEIRLEGAQEALQLPLPNA